MAFKRKKGTLFGEKRSEVIRRPGALTAKAKAAGKSVSAYCSGLGEGADTRTKRQCNLAAQFRAWKK